MTDKTTVNSGAINTELKPCPFCGGEAELEPNGTCIGLFCSDCNCGWEYQISDYLTWEQRNKDKVEEVNEDGFLYEDKHVKICRDKLIKAWNTRHEDKQLKGLVDESQRMQERVEELEKFADERDLQIMHTQQQLKVIVAKLDEY